MIDTITDLANQVRKSAGMAPVTTDTGKSSVIAYIYTISINDTAGTVKDIESLEVHEIGETIFDAESAQTGTILRISRKTKRL